MGTSDNTNRHTEHEAQILSAGASAPPLPAGGATSPGQGVFSGTLNNFNVALSAARNAIPNVLGDIEIICAAGETTGKRVRAGVAFSLKMAVIGAICFAVYQEWLQHIISATEIAASQARKIKAEECSARMKAFIDNVPMNKLLEGNEELARDCDPTYAARETKCDEKFRALLTEVDSMNASEAGAEKRIADRVAQHRSECTITDAQRQLAADRAKTYQTEVNQTKAKAEATIRDASKAREEFTAGRYAEAFRLSQKHAADVEPLEVKAKGQAGELTASAFSKLSWHALFARKFAEANAAATRALKLKPGDLVPEMNRAHAFMMMGRTGEAKAVYLAHIGEKIDGRGWEDVIREDFGLLRKAGISHPLMDEVTATFPAPRPAAPEVTATPRRVTEAAGASTPVVSTAQPPPAENFATAATQLNLRACPEKHCPGVAQLPEGMRVKVLGDAGNNGWLKVSLALGDGKTVEGFVNGKYLQ